ncbi:MAG: ABC transporter permease subunit, partial [Pseudohongiellaceae bacterium]
MTTPWRPGPGDFAAFTAARGHERLARPAQSYWQDAWRRLQQNRRALLSLQVLVFMGLFTVLGPLLWRQDPSYQDLDNISRSPGLGSPALVVADPGNWQAPELPEAPPAAVNATGPERTAAISIADVPNTQYVRLVWEPVAGAASYLVYRNDHAPESAEDLGLPLAQTLNGRITGFQDRLQLAPQTYWYSVIASDGFSESSAVATQRVDVQRGISASQARELGLDATPGITVRLAAHPFGTDHLGRDLLARTMYGARVSLFIGIVAPFLFVLFGTLYGGISGYFGGTVDIVMMRLADFVIALPFLLFMILFRIAFGIGPGESGIFPMLLALVLLRWPDTARLVRGQILQIREEAYVQAARMLGASPAYLILRHMIPNTIGPLLVTLTFAIPMAIFTEAFLSFIGMGVAPPVPSWGSMSNEGIRTMLSSPHELIVPAVFIVGAIAWLYAEHGTDPL